MKNIPSDHADDERNLAGLLNADSLAKRHPGKTLARYVFGTSGLYKHSLWNISAIMIDADGVESDGGLIREFDSKKQAKAAAKVMNDGIAGGPKYGPGHGR